MKNWKVNITPDKLKTAAMLVAAPRYVGLLLYLAGFTFSEQALSWLHVAEGVAGLSLAVLEGFALSFILSRRQLGFSTLDKWLLYFVVGLLLVLLPVCAAPYLLFLYDGSSLFADQLGNSVHPTFKFIWATATASMPILIVLGVALVEKDPVDVEILNAERQALLQQTLSRIEAETEQATLRYQLEAQQARAEHRTKRQQVEEKAERDTSKPYVCENCGSAFEKPQGLAGHKRSCKAKAKVEQGDKLSKPTDEQNQASVNGKVSKEELVR